MKVSTCPIRFLVDGSKSVGRLANMTESLNGSRLPRVGQPASATAQRFQSSSESQCHNAFWSMISLGSNWMSVNNVTLAITKSMSRLFRVFVEATSLILSKINSPLKFKAPPPHEIWLTGLRRIWLAAASRSHRYDRRCLRKMWLTAAASWLRLRRLPVACYKAGLPTVTHRVAKLLF